MAPPLRDPPAPTPAAEAALLEPPLGGAEDGDMGGVGREPDEPGGPPPLMPRKDVGRGVDGCGVGGGVGRAGLGGAGSVGAVGGRVGRATVVPAVGDVGDEGTPGLGGTEGTEAGVTGGGEGPALGGRGGVREGAEGGVGREGGEPEAWLEAEAPLALGRSALAGADRMGLGGGDGATLGRLRMLRSG